MAKPIEDRGHLAAATKPLQIKRYEAGKLPDPGQCTDCLIIVNDRSDGQPRARLAMSNGAAWDHLAWLDEIKNSGQHEIQNSGQPQAIAVRPADIDLTPLVRAAVEQALPAMLPILPDVRVVQAQQIDDEALQPVANALLEMSEHVNRVLHDNAKLMARVEYLENHSLARAELTGT